jgi:hypothetical protein
MQVVVWLDKSTVREAAHYTNNLSILKLLNIVCVHSFALRVVSFFFFDEIEIKIEKNDVRHITKVSWSFIFTLVWCRWFN